MFETPEEGIARKELNRRHFEYRECIRGLVVS